MPTVNGYVRFHPDSLQVVKASNPLIITSFKVDDAEMIQGSEGTISEALIVPADSRFFHLSLPVLICRTVRTFSMNTSWKIMINNGSEQEAAIL